MFKIALIIVNLLNVYPQNLWDFVSAIAPTELHVVFEQPNQLAVGAPVVMRGAVIGQVESISAPGARASAAEFTLSVSDHRLIRRGAVAVISSHVATDSGHAVYFVELLSPPITEAPLAIAAENNRTGKNGTLPGYSSFMDFWKSGSAYQWIDESPSRS